MSNLVRISRGVLLRELPERDEVVRLDRDGLGLLRTLLGRLLLLVGDHVGVSSLGVVEEDLLERLLLLGVADVGQRLEADGDTLLGVLVDRDARKVRLTDSNNRGHNEHRLEKESGTQNAGKESGKNAPRRGAR